MNNSQEERQADARKALQAEVENREARKLKARREKQRSIWFGMGMFGMIGWAVAIPTLIGIAVGLWIDTTWPSQYSWTLMCLLMGVALGCLNAWMWVQRESRDPNANHTAAEDENGQ